MICFKQILSKSASFFLLWAIYLLLIHSLCKRFKISQGFFQYDPRSFDLAKDKMNLYFIDEIMFWINLFGGLADLLSLVQLTFFWSVKPDVFK